MLEHEKVDGNFCIASCAVVILREIEGQEPCVVLLLQSSNSINYKFTRAQGIAALGQRLQMVCQYVKKSCSAHAAR
jgi:hypothetical protein